MEDAKIIDLYFARDEQAITETQKKYSKYLYTIAYNVLSSHEDAEECESDTYVSAWNCMPPEHPSFLRAFLGSITRNLSLSKLRRERAQKRTCEGLVSLDELGECIPDGCSFDSELNANSLGEAIDSFLRSLGETQRNVFILRYYYCEPIADIAARYKFTVGKVTMMLSRSRDKLLKHLKKEGYFNER